MHRSLERYYLSQDTTFQNRVLMVAIEQAHDIMNEREDRSDPNQARLRNKATDLLNNPEQYRERLALSVANFCPDADVTDEELIDYVSDVFDGLAGVSPLVEDTPSE